MSCYVDYDESLIAKDSYIEMKCISCGHEEKMPSFIYGEEADYLLDIGVDDSPCFQCSKCHQDTLYRKGIQLPKKINVFLLTIFLIVIFIVLSALFLCWIS